MRTDGADRVDELDAAWVERPEPEADRTDEELETALLAYAHQRATRWGAERFAAEFERRDEEERRLTGTGAPPFRYPWEPDEVVPPPSSVLSGLVDAAVQEQVVRSDPAELDLAEPPKIGTRTCHGLLRRNPRRAVAGVGASGPFRSAHP